MRFKCPHCGSYSTVRSSRMMTSTCALARYRCSNDFCGFVFQGMGEITGCYVPSMMANPAVVLPMLAAPRHSSAVAGQRQGRDRAPQVLEAIPSTPRRFHAVDDLRKER
ncbi:MAG: ogr/Delta-like zinc finger family protein [Shewanella sp.]